jgi:hypothetical protein
MSFSVRDNTPHHTYGEHLTSSDEQRFNLIEGAADAMIRSPVLRFPCRIFRSIGTGHYTT